METPSVESLGLMGTGFTLAQALDQVKARIHGSESGLVITGKPPFGNEAESSVTFRSGKQASEYDVTLRGGMSGREAHVVISPRGKDAPSSFQQLTQATMKASGQKVTDIYRAECLGPGDTVIDLLPKEEDNIMHFLVNILITLTLTQYSDEVKRLKLGMMGHEMKDLSEKIWF